MDKKYYNEVDFSSLKIHQMGFINEYTKVLRVPGGYIYSFYDEHGTETSGTFVPKCTILTELKIYILK